MDKAHFHSTTHRGNSPQQHGHWDTEAVNLRSDSAQNKGSQRQGLTWEEAASSLSPGSGSVSYWFNFVFFVVDPQDSKTQELCAGTVGYSYSSHCADKTQRGEEGLSGSQFEGSVHRVGRHSVRHM